MSVNRRPTASLDELRMALEEAPDDLVTLLRLARLELLSDDPGEALTHFQRAAQLDPNNPDAWNGVGEALRGLGRAADALNAFMQAVRVGPGFAAAHCNVGLSLRAMGRREAAMAALRHAVRLQPDFVEALSALGGLLHASGQYPAAIECFRAIRRLQPNSARAHTSLGASLQMLGNLTAARACYEKAVELAPDYPDAHSNLGTVLQGLREMDKAEACFRRALEIAPDHLDALASLASHLDRRGRYREALALIEDRLSSGHVELVLTGAQVLRNLGRSEDAADLLETLLSRGRLTAAQQQRLEFTRGDVLDDLGRYKEAFSAYRSANRAKPIRFDRHEHHADVARTLEVFSERSWPDLVRIEELSERPVFIVGMPRSGTSLVEQILACHSQVAGAGELTEIPRAAIELGKERRIRFPDSMLTTTEAELRRSAATYLERLDRVSSDALRVTDKTPANHLFIGFIQNLFPRARIIHCVRHPLDTCLSNYFRNFAGVGLPYSYDLTDIAVYYNHYLQLMEHWRRHASIRLHEMVYEELVDDQEGVSRELVAFLGLQWEPGCLNFHQSDRLVATASHAQVRRPLYRHSVGRFRNYEDELRPLIENLDWEAWRRSGFADRVDARVRSRPLGE